MKKIHVLAASALIATFFLAACAGGAPAVGGGETSPAAEAPADQVFTIMMSTSQADGAPVVQGFRDLSDALYERSNGRLVMNIFPSSALGADDDVIEQAMQGVNVAMFTDASQLGNFVRDIGIIQAPFILDSYEDILTLIESDLFRGWEEELATQHGIRILAMNWYDGARHFLTNTPIHTPADLAGVRIRTPGSAVFQESVRAMGATPIAMPWGETYPAIQQGAVDGAEAQNTATYNSRIFEVLSYVNKTGHFHLIQAIITGEDFFRSMPEDLQQILLEEAGRIGSINARMIQDVSDEVEASMVAQGMTVIYPDVEAFRQAAEAAYEALDFVELRQQVRAIIEN